MRTTRGPPSRRPEPRRRFGGPDPFRYAGPDRNIARHRIDALPFHGPRPMSGRSVGGAVLADVGVAIQPNGTAGTDPEGNRTRPNCLNKPERMSARATHTSAGHRVRKRPPTPRDFRPSCRPASPRARAPSRAPSRPPPSELALETRPLNSKTRKRRPRRGSAAGVSREPKLRVRRTFRERWRGLRRGRFPCASAMPSPRRRRRRRCRRCGPGRR